MAALEKVLVLDSSAFIMGLDPLHLNLEQYTTPEVIGELNALLLQFRYSTAIYLKRLRLVSPKEKFILPAKEAAAKTGDLQKLSKADLSILALAMELKLRGLEPYVLSDDFSVQNVAEALGLGFLSFSGKGIKSRIEWVWYCPACRRRFPQSCGEKICPVCGTEIKRKARKKFSLKQGKI